VSRCRGAVNDGALPGTPRQGVKQKWSIMKMRMDPRIPSEAPRTDVKGTRNPDVSRISARGTCIDHTSVAGRCVHAIRGSCGPGVLRVEFAKDRAGFNESKARYERVGGRIRRVVSCQLGCSPNKARDPITSQPIRKPKSENSEPISPARLHRAMPLRPQPGSRWRQICENQ